MRVLLGVSLIALAAACGGEGSQAADAPPPPEVDAPPGDPQTRTVRLTITDDILPKKGVIVLFQHADGALVAAVATDAQGVADAELPAGGFVTAINPFGSAPPGVDGGDLRTFAGVAPGDRLVLHRPFPGYTFSFLLTVPTRAGATSYKLWSSCRDGDRDLTTTGGSGGLPGALVEMNGCDPDVDFVVEPRDASGLALGGLVASGPLGGITGYDLRNGEYKAVADTTFTYGNLPAAVTGVSLLATEHTKNGHVIRIRREPPVTGGGATVTLRRPLVQGADMAMRTRVATGGIATHAVTDWAPLGTTYVFNGTNVFLRQVAAPPAFELASHTLRWLELAGTQPDLAIARVKVRRPDSTGAKTWTWEIAAPYTVGALPYPPALPDAHAAFVPRTGDEVALERLLLARVPGGYGAVRATALAKDVRDGIFGIAGRIVAQEVVGGP